MTTSKQEADRCLLCKAPMCKNGCPSKSEKIGCPAGTAVPQVIALYKEGKLKEAGEMLFDNNPLSLICSIVCDHNQQCEGSCVLNLTKEPNKKEPIQFGRLMEQEISNPYLTELLKTPKQNPSGKKVAVIGAGAAGLTAAIILGRAGCRVTLFEAEAKIGGTMQYGIPAFRLNKEIFERYHTYLELLGVNLRFNSKASVNSLTLKEMQRDGYESIFITTGATEPFKLGIKGETLPHVHYGVHFLKNPNCFNIGQKVAVIGAGSAALDVARTAIKQGATEVSMYVRSAEAKLHNNIDEMNEAKHEGAKIFFMHPPVEFVEGGVVFNVLDEETKAVLETKTVQADSVIIAISQGPDAPIDPDLKLNAKGLYLVNEKGETNLAGVYACGDNVTGANTVVHAVAVARDIARRILAD